MRLLQHLLNNMGIYPNEWRLLYLKLHCMTRHAKNVKSSTSALYGSKHKHKKQRPKYSTAVQRPNIGTDVLIKQQLYWTLKMC